MKIMYRGDVPPHCLQGCLCGWRLYNGRCQAVQARPARRLRAIASGYDCFCEFVGPSGPFSLSADSAFGPCGSQDVEGQSAQDCEVFGSVAGAVSGCLLIEGDVGNPMQAVLDGPLADPKIHIISRRQFFFSNAIGLRKLRRAHLISGMVVGKNSCNFR